MKQAYKILLSVLSLLLVAACGSNNTPEPSSTLPAVEAATATQQVRTPKPTNTAIATASPTSRPLIVYPPADPATVALDFVEAMCTATWSNSISFFGCPGASGAVNSVSRVDSPLLATGQSLNLPALLVVPMQHNGVFGRYTGFTVYPGDEFRALVSCKEPSLECEVGFSLEYYANGKFYGYPNALINSEVEVGEEGYAIMRIPLNALAGQKIDLLLSVRDKAGLDGTQALWVNPYIYRDPNATPASPAANNASNTNNPAAATATEDTRDKTPGVISGYINYASSPGAVNNGEAMTVMFFHQEDFTWWWVQTAYGSPYFQMTMPPGPYLVTAYTQVGGSLYQVGYTGGGSSCGAGLRLVNLTANGEVSNLALTDWCNPGYWPAAPGEVPIP